MTDYPPVAVFFSNRRCMLSIFHLVVLLVLCARTINIMFFMCPDLDMNDIGCTPPAVVVIALVSLFCFRGVASQQKDRNAFIGNLAELTGGGF